jgi:hypothetical protein
MIDFICACGEWTSALGSSYGRLTQFEEQELDDSGMTFRPSAEELPRATR